jgi:hypothetical protein
LPSQLKSNKIDCGLEFEWPLCVASRFQTSQRVRPTEIRGLPRLAEFPKLTTSGSLGENPRGRSILDGRYRNHEAKKRAPLSPSVRYRVKKRIASCSNSIIPFETTPAGCAPDGEAETGTARVQPANEWPSRKLINAFEVRA